MKKIGFSIKFSFTIFVGQHMMSIMFITAKHQLSVDILYPASWKYLPYLTKTSKRIEVTIK